MKRRLFTVLSALSLLLFIATLALWADTGYLLGSRGYRSTRSTNGPELGTTQYVVGVDSRALHLSRDSRSDKSIPGPYSPANRIATPEILAWQSTLGRSSSWRWNGFLWTSRPSIGTAVDGQLWMLGWQSSLLVPFWALLIAFAILPVWRWQAQGRWRRQARLQRGHCPFCDYDLRASKDRCPECGTPIPQAADPSNAQP